MNLLMRHCLRLLLGLLFLFQWGCIPIEDTFNPNINDLVVGNEYALEDTLTATSVITDNFALEKAFIRITQIAGATVSTWEVEDSIALAGRRFEFDYKTQIPLSAAPGTYSINIEVVDVGNNRSFLRGSFVVVGDRRGPVIFEEITLLEPQEEPYRIVDGRFVVCRLSVLNLTGAVRDNVGIARVTAQLGNLPGVSRLIDPAVDTLRLDGIFDSDIRIPATTLDLTELNLRVVITDVEGNSVETSIPIVVDCDDEIPQIPAIAYAPEPDSLTGVLPLVEEGSFRISELELSDNRALDSLFIFFNPQGENLDTIYTINLSNAQTADLSFVLNQLNEDSLFVTLPVTAEFGDIYELTVLVADTSGNFSEAQQLTVPVRNDTPPRITVAEVRINEQTQAFSDSIQGTAEAPFRIEARQEVSLAGKITDDRGLIRVELRWGIEGQEQTAFLADQTALGGATTFDFDDPRIPEEAFRIPEDASPDTVYRLLISATDTRNVTVERTLYFRVLD